VAEERSGNTLGTHSHEEPGARSAGVLLDEWAHEIHDGDHVADLDAPPEDRFGDAVLAHHEQLARLAFMLSGSQEIAEASVTEAYARLWPKFRRGRIRTALPYLVREVIVEVHERSRLAGPRPGEPTGNGEFETPWAALLHLAFEQRSAVVLHVVEGLGLEESAMLLDEPVAVTTGRVDLGLERLAELLVAGDSNA
jgi:DNA-directed RNA polymerase specialized sigma24 family protein